MANYAIPRHTNADCARPHPHPQPHHHGMALPKQTYAPNLNLNPNLKNQSYLPYYAYHCNTYPTTKGKKTLNLLATHRTLVMIRRRTSANDRRCFVLNGAARKSCCEPQILADCWRRLEVEVEQTLVRVLILLPRPTWTHQDRDKKNA